MSRAAIYDALLADTRLTGSPPTYPNGLGLDSSSIVINYDGDQRPSDEFFIVLGWGSDDTIIQGDDIFQRNAKNLTIWVHMYRKLSTDFVHIDKILDIIDNIFDGMIHVDGTDGNSVSMVEKGQRSRDMRDDAYQTLCRSASYRVLIRETAIV